MPQPAQTLHVPAAVPLDEVTRPEHLPLGQANRRAENVRAVQHGALSKRDGFGVLGVGRFDSTSRSAGRRMFARGKQICTIDGTRLDTYDHLLATWLYDKDGQPMTAPSVDLVPTPVTSYGSSTYVLDVAAVNEHAVVLCRVTPATGGAYTAAAVVNRVTGATVRGLELLSSGGNARTGALGLIGNTVIAIMNETGDNNLSHRIIDLSSAAGINTGWSSLTHFKTDMLNAATIDGEALAVEELAASSLLAVAYVNNSGGASLLTVTTLNASGTVTATTTVNTSSVVPKALALAAGASGVNSVLWAAWTETTAVKCIGLNATSIGSTVYTTGTLVTMASAISQYTGGKTGAIAIVPSDGSVSGDGRLIVNDGNGTTLHLQTFTNAAGAVATSGSVVDVPNAFLCGRPFRSGSRYYGMCFGGANSNAQKVAVLCDLTASTTYLRPVANVKPSLATPPGVICRALHQSGAIVTGVTVQTTGSVHGVWLAAFEFTPGGSNTSGAQRWATVEHAGATYVGGGLLTVVDGNRLTEASFLIRPTQPTTSVGGTGITGDFRYVAVYEYLTADGLWDVSGVSDPSAVVSPANQTVTVTVRPLSISARLTATSDPKVRISLYRTLDGGEPPYYYVASTANNTSAATLTFTDANTDAIIAVNAKLYRQPGVNGTAQDRRPSSGLLHLATCNGVLVGASGDELAAAGQEVSGELGWFSPVFTCPITGGGPITGVESQDGAAFAWKRDRLYAVPVEPPSDNGAALPFGAPRLLATDVGCINARSIVKTALGIFFQSERGIEILTRAQSVEFIGEPVSTTTSAYPVITSAVLDEARALVYFECSEAEPVINAGAAGRTLVYDLTLGQRGAWLSVDRRPNYGGTADAPAQSSAVVWNGTEYVYGWLEAGSGRVHLEADQDGDTVSGGSEFITSLWEPAPVRLGLQQEQRLFEAEILFEEVGAAGLLIENGYDDAAYDAANDSEWTEAEVSGETALAWRPKPRGRALSFRISDTEPAEGASEGLTFIGLSLDIAAIRGATRGTPRLDTSLRK